MYYILQYTIQMPYATIKVIQFKVAFLQSWTKVLGHFCVSEKFSNSHRSTRLSRIVSEFQLCIGWREGELQENLENDALF